MSVKSGSSKFVSGGQLQPCKYVFKGCHKMCSSADMNTHQSTCIYRPIECENCGQKLIARDMFTHQKIRKCYESRLKREIVLSNRRLHSANKSHSLALQREQAQRDFEEHHLFRNRLHDKIGYTPRVPSAWGSRPRNGHSWNENRRRSSASSLSSGMTMIPLDDDTVDGLSDIANAVDGEPVKCVKCDKMYRVKNNHENACRSHRGPIVDLFGGTCQNCGQLTHQKGCVQGPHSYHH